MIRSYKLLGLLILAGAVKFLMTENLLCANQEHSDAQPIFAKRGRTLTFQTSFHVNPNAFEDACEFLAAIPQSLPLDESNALVRPMPERPLSARRQNRGSSPHPSAIGKTVASLHRSRENSIDETDQKIKLLKDFARTNSVDLESILGIVIASQTSEQAAHDLYDQSVEEGDIAPNVIRQKFSGLTLVQARSLLLLLDKAKALNFHLSDFQELLKELFPEAEQGALSESEGPDTVFEFDEKL